MVEITREDDNNNGPKFDAKIVEALSVNSLCTTSQQPAELSNLWMANLLANQNMAGKNAVNLQQGLNELGVAVTGKTVAMTQRLGPLQATSAAQVFTGNETAETIASLSAVAGRKGVVPPPQPSKVIVLLPNPGAAPYTAVAPTALKLMNVGSKDTLKIRERSVNGRTLFDFTCDTPLPVALPINVPKPPSPLPPGSKVQGFVPLTLSYEKAVNLTVDDDGTVLIVPAAQKK